MIAFNNVGGDSDYLTFRQFARDARDTFGVYSYIVVPEHMAGKLPDEEHLYHLFTGYVGEFYDSQADVPPEFFRWFNPRLGEFQVDAVVTSRTGAAGYLQRILMEPRGDTIPVVIEESIPADYSNPASTNTNETDLMNRSMSYAIAARSLFDTPLEREIALRAARRFLSGYSIELMEKKMTVNPCGIACDAIDQIVKGVEKNKKFTLFFGGRLNNLKRSDKMLEMYDEFFAGGRDVRVVISTPKSGTSSFPLDWKKRCKEIELLHDVKRENFLRIAAGSHVMANTSAAEGFSVGLMEQMYLGLVVLLPKLAWVKSLLLEKYDEYPFLYGDFTEAATILRWVYENFEEAQRRVSWVPIWIREKYDSKVVNQSTVKLLKEVSEEFRSDRLWSVGNRQVMEQALAENKKKFLTVIELYAIMCSVSRTYREYDIDNPRRGKISRWSIYKFLQSKGFEDVKDGPEARFKVR